MDIRKEVLDANRWIVEKGLVELTWGNVSGLVDNKIVINEMNEDSTVITFTNAVLNHAISPEMWDVRLYAR